jgi:hypothetical protein
MRSPVKQFESICLDHELKWGGVSRPIAPDLVVKYNLLLAAVQPFIEAAKHIPEGTSPDETIYGTFPPLGLFVGDFYNLLSALGKGN